MNNGADLSRRAVLSGSLAAVVGASLGAVAVTAPPGSDPGRETVPATGVTTAPPALPAVIDPYGTTQAGIALPATPQRSGLLCVATLAAPTDLGFLPALGRRIASLAQSPPVDVLPDGPGGLTVTVGLGPRAAAATGAGAPDCGPLPRFRGDADLATGRRGGDLLLSLSAHDPGVLAPALADLLTAVPGARPAWVQRGWRGPGDGTIVRNPLGFHDGVTVPRGRDELAANVWLDGAWAGGTICFVRRLRLDIPRFEHLARADREAVIGRTTDGVPLSGGTRFAPVDLDAKAPDGTYLIPPRSHARAAHPGPTGSSLMLRRGYAFDNGGTDAGLLFVAFARDLRTFVLTQQRLDEQDDLMGFATPTASASFAILPGFGPDRPLGSLGGARRPGGTPLW